MAVLGGDRYFATATDHSTRRYEMTFKMAAVGTDMETTPHPGGNQKSFTDFIHLYSLFYFIKPNQIDSDPDDEYEI